MVVPTATFIPFIPPLVMQRILIAVLTFLCSACTLQKPTVAATLLIP